MKTDAVANHAVRNQPPVQKNVTQPVPNNNNANKPAKETPKTTENNATQQNNAAGQINITA
jgi:hypothetical protein